MEGLIAHVIILRDEEGNVIYEGPGSHDGPPPDGGPEGLHAEHSETVEHKIFLKPIFERFWKFLEEKDKKKYKV